MRLRAYTYSQRLTERLEFILTQLLQQYSQLHLYDCLHSCMVETITNAMRANLKFLYLNERRINLQDEDAYLRGLSDFKQEKRIKEWQDIYKQKIRENRLYVEVNIDHSIDGMRIETINNLPLLPIDEKRIRSKFAHAMQVDSLADFYETHQDDTEGEGLGFVLSVMYLRSLQLDPALFRIGVIQEKTVARLEIPFTTRFRSVRNNNTPA